MTLVLDASVIIKWLLLDPEREADTLESPRVGSKHGDVDE